MLLSNIIRHTPVTLPEWFSLANDTAGITRKEVCLLFDYTDDGLKNAMVRENFPRADFEKISKTAAFKNLSKHSGRLNKWKKKTLLDEITRRLKLIDEMKGDKTMAVPAKTKSVNSVSKKFKKQLDEDDFVTDIPSLSSNDLVRNGIALSSCRDDSDGYSLDNDFPTEELDFHNPVGRW